MYKQFESDTNILERALKSKEQKLDHLVMKHHNTAKHLRKVLKWFKNGRRGILKCVQGR